MRWVWALPAVVLLAAACGEPEGDLVVSMPDRAMFDLQVLPILERDCAFHACHGARERFFQIVGPGRPRLSPFSDHFDEITVEEREFNYQRARSMIKAADPSQSPLLLKPLSLGAGGDGHQGTDEFGRDVYKSKNDASFKILSDWAHSGVAAAPASSPTAGVAPIAGTAPMGGMGALGGATGGRR